MSSTPKRPKRRDGQIQCKNCPAWFTPRAKGGSPQEFCSDTCRKQFHRNGAAFGKLRDKLPGFINSEVRKQVGEPLRELLVDVLSVIERLNDRANISHGDELFPEDILAGKPAADIRVRELIKQLREQLGGANRVH